MSTVVLRDRQDAFTREQVAGFCILLVLLVNTIGVGRRHKVRDGWDQRQVWDLEVWKDT